jgi:hypothetical protein
VNELPVVKILIITIMTIKAESQVFSLSFNMRSHQGFEIPGARTGQNKPGKGKENRYP